MDISSITGPDIVPTGFTPEQPRTEQASEQRREEARPQEQPGEERGRNIDTYA
ncbi:MAG: hypothetical protein JXA20_00110 [Spirochaetes bacterium]|nr:hypothetical protein [Spirochaetota bacterium]